MWLNQYASGWGRLAVGFSFSDRWELEVDAYMDNGDLDSTTGTERMISVQTDSIHSWAILTSNQRKEQADRQKHGNDITIRKQNCTDMGNCHLYKRLS